MAVFGDLANLELAPQQWLPPPLALWNFDEGHLESFDETEEDAIAPAIQIATNEHLTFMPQTTGSVFSNTLEPLDLDATDSFLHT